MFISKLVKWLLVLLSLAATAFSLVYYSKNKETEVTLNTLPSGPSATAEGPFLYSAPTIPKNRSYRIVLVGDSMTKALGPNANKLREYLIEYYPQNEFVIYNYGYSSTNIETLPVRLIEKTVYLGVENQPILTHGFELIIVESFGYNPLSYGSLEAGLKKQEEVLDKSIELIVNKKREAAILFMTPIAPDPETFAMGTYELSREARNSWVEERVKYIDNFRAYALQKKIPLIDIYKASLNKDGSINKTYIAGDHVHPSEAGIDLMAREIADFIAVNKIFPE